MNKRFPLVFTAVLQAFNGLSGLFGGVMLISNPTGQSLEMDRLWLETTPFSSFLLPGIILFLLVGAANLAGFLLSLRKNEKAPSFAGLCGIILILWISAQVLWLGFLGFLQPLYFLTGLLQLLASFLHLRNRAYFPR